jgi:hypothetical protein
MKTVWTKGVKAEDVELMEREFKEARALRKRLKELLEEKLNTKRTEKRSKDGYANPNWAYFQADAIGYERAITEILSIIED